MENTRPFRVVIGGGGIAGLTLANALEKANIDYVLLESRNTVSPQVGASIGFLPNGGRIMDQLGCFDQLERTTVPLHSFFNHYANGILIDVADGMTLSAKRHNYPTTFVEREAVLRALYANLKDKSRIKVQKRISQVDHNAEGVVAICEDGTAVAGDILVGCDGVNSKIRNELWRLSQEAEQDLITADDQKTMFAEYRCLYGIATETAGIEEGEIHITHAEGSCTMVIGSKGRTFWFLVEKLPKAYRVPDIPHYTKEDADAFSTCSIDRPITTTVKYGDIWMNRKSYTLVPLEEGQLKRWTWGRIVCVGDCVHKMTPNMGAGGNTAIESAAALANELKKMADEAEKGRPSFSSVKKHLGRYQAIREERVSTIVVAANGVTRVHALNTWMDKLFAWYVLPWSGDAFTDMSCDMVLGALKLDYLPVPDRSLHGTMPFNPSQGLGKAESKLLRAVKALPFLGISAAAMYFMWGVALPPMKTRIGEIMEVGVHSQIGQSGHVRPLHSFYGLDFVDSRFRGLAACFASVQFVDNIGSWQLFHFLNDMGIVYAILLIEGARRANKMTFAYVPLLFGYNAQFFGIGVLLALYCFLHYVQSPIENFRARDMRLTDMAYTASVLPVMILAFYIPSYGAFLNWINPQTRHMWNWIWQPFPVYISILQVVLKYTFMPDTVQTDRIENTQRDLPTIQYTIGSLCALDTAMWWYILYAAPYLPSTLFIPNLAPDQSGDAYIRMFLQFDQIFATSACLLWLLYLYGDMKRAGMMEDNWISILLKGGVSLVALGPGVTIGLGWLYRERLLATKWHKDALVPGKKN